MNRVIRLNSSSESALAVESYKPQWWKNIIEIQRIRHYIKPILDIRFPSVVSNLLYEELIEPFKYKHNNKYVCRYCHMKHKIQNGCEIYTLYIKNIKKHKDNHIFPEPTNNYYGDIQQIEPTDKKLYQLYAEQHVNKPFELEHLFKDLTLSNIVQMNDDLDIVEPLTKKLRK